MTVPGNLSSPLLATATAAAAAAEYVIPKSLRFNAGDSANLSKNFSSAGNTKTWTWSAWAKFTHNGSNEVIFNSANGNNFHSLYLRSDGTLKWDDVIGGSDVQLNKITDQVFRDFSAWYHIVLAVDTTQSTAANRNRMYVNGVQATFASGNDFAQNDNSQFNQGNAFTHNIGSGYNASYSNVYLADVQFVDGQALAPTDLAETRSSDGVWVPKEYTGEYGPLVDQSQTWSTYGSHTGSTNNTTGTGWQSAFDASGTTYTWSTNGSDLTFTSAIPYTQKVEIWGYKFNSSDAIRVNGSAVSGFNIGNSDSQLSWVTALSGSGNLTSIGSTGYGLIARVRVDGKLLIDAGVSVVNNGFHLNFSDSSTNEALGFDSAPTIPDLDPKKGFDVVTYAGTGATQSVGGLNFEPGLVWIKEKSSTSDHGLWNTVVGSGTYLSSNLNASQYTTGTEFVSFDPGGFTVGASTMTNQSGQTNVAWCWRAGGSAVANTSGTITSQVSANTDYGFSICKITTPSSDGAYTFGHGLNAVPKLVIYRIYDQAMSWYVHHGSLNANEYLLLNSNNAKSSGGSVVFNNTYPTSSLISDYAGNSSHHNEGRDMIYYSWSEVAGYSKISSYTGGGSTDVTVDCGFKPKLVIAKNADGAFSWYIADSERATSNPFDELLYANTSEAETTSGSSDHIRFTDTGFVVEGNSNTLNQSGSTFIFAAFADRPGNNWDVNNIVTNEGLTTSKTQFDVVTYTGNGGTQRIGGPVFSASAVSSITNASNIFDGSTSTGGYSSSTGTDLTLTTSSFTISTQLRVYNNFRSDGTYAICLNGTCVTVAGSGTDSTQYRWSTVDLSGFTLPLTVTSLGYSASQTSGNTIRAIEVDSTILVDGTGPGLKFQPDLIWIKSRSSAQKHVLVDSVRTTSTGEYLASDSTQAEGTGVHISGTSNGFKIDDPNASTIWYNDSNHTYVAWCWKAGGSSNTYNINGTGYSTASAAGVDGGDITPSAVSASTTSGFAIVKYTGNGADNQSIATGLTQKLGFMIIKPLSSGTWFTRNASLAEGEAIILTDDLARNNWDGRPSEALGSGLLKLENGASHNDNVNTSGTDYIAYCFADVPGYQRVGKYTGSGASGNTIVTGFRPAFVLIKGSSHGGDWTIYDAARGNDNYLSANKTDAEENFSTKDFTFTNNGFVLEGNDNSVNASGRTYIYFAIGDDEIGSDEDCLVDVPNAVTADADATDTTGGYQRGNYATLNPLSSQGGTLSNGNLAYTGTNNNFATIGVATGKWYWEVTNTGTLDNVNNTFLVGVASDTQDSGTFTKKVQFYSQASQSAIYRNSGSAVETLSGTTLVNGDVLGIALDLDSATQAIQFYKNGAAIGNSTALNDDDETWTPSVKNAPASIAINFGQMRFKYPMPSGYAALNTTALPAATIADGSAYFDAVTYTSDNQASKKLTFGFGPDFFWSKVRNFAEHHVLHDSVRGPSKVLKSSSTAVESTEASGRGVLSFDSDGVTIGIGSPYNSSGNNSVVFGWNAGANSNKTYTVKVVSDSGNKYRFDDFGTSAVTLDLEEGSTYIFDQSDSSNAGHPIRFGTSANGTDYTTGVTHTGTPGSAGAKTTLVLGTGVATLYYSCANHSGMGGQINTNSTAGASNFDGTIQAKVKANPEAGFSIAIYPGSGSSGDTLGHGLNAEPEFAIVKARTKTDDWRVYHKAIGTGHYLQLNSTNAKTTTGNWQSVSSTTLGLNSDSAVNSSSYTYLALFFAPVAGYSAFGSYSSNQSTDGPFIHLGFRPRWILLKASVRTYGSNWSIIDTARNTGNFTVSASGMNILYASTNGAEFSSGGAQVDILSNGFKIRNNSSDNNDNGTYIYAAFAENPFSANGGLAR